MYYEVYGTGEPLILISGCGGDHTFWQSSIPELASHFQVIVFDTRGIGRTDAPDGVYSIRLFADDLASLMDALQLKKAHLLGFSMGVSIAQAFALVYPERVLKPVRCWPGNQEDKPDPFSCDGWLRSLVRIARRRDDDLAKEVTV